MPASVRAALLCKPRFSGSVCILSTAQGEPITPQVEMIDEALRHQLEDSSHPMHRYLVDFFLHLAVNHAVVLETDQRGVRR